MKDEREMFKANPWDGILTATYPQGRLLYQRDERYWVSINDVGQWVFFIHCKCTENLDININLPSISLALEEYKHDEKRLVCTLLDSSKDLGSKFALVAKYIACETAVFHGRELFKRIIKTFLSWSAFLRPAAGNLTQSELIGFWGELFVVTRMMSSHPIEDVMRYWVGPDGAKKDITLNNIAIEVKATAASGAREINISSLDQLDRTTRKLYLIHLQLTPSTAEIGASLSDLYAELKAKCDADFPTLALFARKTEEIISKANKDQLSERFSLSDFSLYDVCEDFPKIIRADVVEAVVDVKYRLTISSLQPFNVTHNTKEIINNG